MKDCHCNEPKPGFIPAPHKPSGCVPKPCDYIKTYFLPTSLGTDEAGQPYAPKPGAWYDAFVIYEANAAIYFYDHEGVFLHIGGGGVTSINGETGDITLGTLTISMNGEQLAQYNAGQSVEVDLPIPALGEIATGNTGYINGDMAHELQANLSLALATETGAREEADEALSTGLQTEATARKNADEELKRLINTQGSEATSAIAAETEAREDADNALQTNINNEITARTNADNELREAISSQSSDAQSAITAEEAARKAADKTLQDNITANQTNIATNTSDIASLKTKTDTTDANLTQLAEKVANNVEALNQTVQRDTTITADDSTVTITKTTGNIKDSTSAETALPLPVASETTAGVMSPAIYTSFQNVASKVEAMEGGSIELSDLTADISQEDLTTAWKEVTGKTDLINDAKILDTANNKVWTYYANTNKWVSVPTGAEVISIGIATEDTTGVVKSSNTAGMVKVEVDGTMSLNGYDTLTANDSNMASQIESLQSQVSDNAAAIATNASKIVTNTNEIATHSTQIATNTSDIEANKTAIAALQAGSGSQEQDLTELTAKVSTNTSDITKLKSDLTTTSGNVSTNTANISNLQTTIEGQATDLTQVKADIANNTSNISTLNTTVNDINTAIGQANARLESLVSGAGV